MIRRYGAQDIERWAQFSGDRNRVHFDKAFAIKNGLKGIIVQGMLTLLDAKLLLAESSSKPLCSISILKSRCR